MANALWLFTMRFPFGTGEPFLELELPELCRRFDRVHVVPLFQEGEARELPANASVERVLRDPYATAGPALLAKRLGDFRRGMSALRREAPSPEVFVRRRAELRSRLRQAMQRAEWLEGHLAGRFDPQRDLLYTYWTADWATVLALLKRRHPAWHMVSRVHGFDLFPERDPDGWIPFRSMHLEAMDRIYCVSRAGLDTMERLHPAYRDRFHLARLGTVDHGPGPWEPSDTLRLVSCSNLVPLKRVELIVQALGMIGRPVAWTHFGDGPERGRLEAMARALPDHIQVVWTGAVPNRELIAWYREHSVDLFVHVSASEGGVPVALQEAASFGIPLVACDAGGVRELVSEGTGLLLPVDVDPASLARAIVDASTRLGGDPSFRKGVRARWAEGFQAPVNFGQFCDDLLDLMG